MDDAGLQLLRSLEALMKELVAFAREERDATKTLHAQRSKKAERQARWRVASTGSVYKDTTSSVSVDATDEVVKDLEAKDLRKEPHVDATKTLHNELVVYGVGAFEKATGVKYPFEKQDAKHIENLLKNHTLTVAKRVVDLACERYRREPFHANRGLSFKLVYAEATQLLTAKTTQHSNPDEAEKAKATSAAAKSIEQTRQRSAALAAIKPSPPPKDLRELMSKIGNGK